MKTLKDVTAALPGLETAMSDACRWLTDVSQMRTDTLDGANNSHRFPYTNWRGAFRGEYSAANQAWDFFCPAWHGGQAIKALVLAHGILKESALLSSAISGADFILRHQVREGDDAGLILAYEDLPDKVFISAVLESLDGLFHLAEATGDKRYSEAAISAARWCKNKAWISGAGLIRDAYDPQSRAFVGDLVVTLDEAPGRPLADDAIFLKAGIRTSDPSFRKAFFEVCDRLLQDERPSGNWVDYGPCRPQTEECHPRHAFWWGLPMLFAWEDSKDQVYLNAARRSGEWYIKAQRNDGGLFRFTDDQFRTGSFDHETSGILCASIFWIKLFQATGEAQWLEPIHRALRYAISLQFTHPKDPNLKGCILEKVIGPDGTDRSPYHIRDLGTIFFVQAAAILLSAVEE